MEWIPSKAFCSSACFEKYKASEEGRRLLAEYAVLATGYLRRLDHSFTNETLPAPIMRSFRSAILREQPIEVQEIPVGVSISVELWIVYCQVLLPEFFSPSITRMPSAFRPFTHQPGDVVSMRAKPTAADLRTEWPAVVRSVVHLRSGEAAIFVTWLKPKERDTYYDGDEDDDDSMVGTGSAQQDDAPGTFFVAAFDLVCTNLIFSAGHAEY